MLIKKKILLVTEYINPPFDEGIKKTVYNLFLELEKKFSVHLICRYGFEKENIGVVNTNPLFLSKEIYIIIKQFQADVLIYFPFASSTFASYLRLKVFRLFSNKSKSVFIALQPKPLKVWQKYFVKLLKPEKALTPSSELKEFWDKNKINNELLPLLTDLSIFKPLDNQLEKRNLRIKYGLPVDSFIISHMGHLNEGRNLRSLIPLQQHGNQVIIVGSSSTPKDSTGPKSLKKELEKSGIIIIDKFISNIEEVYQLSDLYIFPVIAKNSSIGLPLSVLEARSCGIPVVTTDFGSLKHFLGTDDGYIIYSQPEKFAKEIIQIKKKILDVKTTNLIENLNQRFYQIIYSVIR